MEGIRELYRLADVLALQVTRLLLQELPMLTIIDDDIAAMVHIG